MLAFHLQKLPSIYIVYTIELHAHTRGGTHTCCILQSSFAFKLKVKGQLEAFFKLWSTVKLLYLFDVLGQIGQGQNKKQYRIIRSCNSIIKKFSQDFDHGQRLEQ